MLVQGASRQSRTNSDWRTTTALLDGLADAANQDAWRDFVNCHRPMMVGYLRKVGLAHDDAEDVAQRAFSEFSAAYSQGKFDRRKGRLRDWLYGIARNQQRNWRRGRSDVPTAEPAIEIEDDGLLQRTWDEGWQSHAIRICLEQIAEEVDIRTLESFQLFCLRGVPAATVATELGLSENAIYLAKRRILRRMKELLDQLDGVD